MKELYSFGNNTIRLSVEIFIHSKRDEQCEMNFLIVLEFVKQIQFDKYLQAFLIRLTYQQKIQISDLTPLSRCVPRSFLFGYSNRSLSHVTSVLRFELESPPSYAMVRRHAHLNYFYVGPRNPGLPFSPLRFLSLPLSIIPV